MAGEVISTDSDFYHYKSKHFNKTFETVTKYGIGNAASMTGEAADSIYNDEFVMRMRYKLNGTWYLDSTQKVNDGEFKALYCKNREQAHWKFEWDATPYGDGKAIGNGSCYIRTLGGPYSNELKGRKVILFNNFDITDSDIYTGAGKLADTLITTTRDVGYIP